MRPQEFSALAVLHHGLSADYQASDDAMVVSYMGEQLFVIERVTAKGCPTYNTWVAEVWVFENYQTEIETFMKEVI